MGEKKLHKLHTHFWFNLNTGQSHNVDHDSSYHIQHVVRNPIKFGYNNADEMQQYAGNHIGDLLRGYNDVDYDLEHHVMNKGFARGYHWRPSGKAVSFGEINVDVSDKEHGVKALTHFLPIVKDAEAKGTSYIVRMGVGHRGKDSYPFFTFSSSKDIEEHIGKIAPTGLKLKEPETFRNVGRVDSVLRGKIKRSIAQTNPHWAPWQLEQEVGNQIGTWGDSMDYKTYKQCFSEAIHQALNENSDNPVSRRARDYPNENDMGGGPPGDPIGFRGLNDYMKREGIISHGFILPRDIEIHGSPFNEDGTINSDHISVQNALETAQRHHGGKDRFKEFYAKLDAQREGRTIEDPLKRYLPYIRIIDRMVDGKQSGHFIQVMDRAQQ